MTNHEKLIKRSLSILELAEENPATKIVWHRKLKNRLSTWHMSILRMGR